MNPSREIAPNAGIADHNEWSAKSSVIAIIGRSCATTRSIFPARFPMLHGYHSWTLFPPNPAAANLWVHDLADAVNELLAKLSLEHRNACRQGRLRHVATSGRTRKMAFAVQRKLIFDESCLHECRRLAARQEYVVGFRLFPHSIGETDGAPPWAAHGRAAIRQALVTCGSKASGATPTWPRTRGCGAASRRARSTPARR